MSQPHIPPIRKYVPADLHPKWLDPHCDPQFPLANLWPVYLGNFRCTNYSEHAVRIQEYFASKGLLVRIVFGPHDDHFQYQQHSKLYDFFVYFVREQDANYAVQYCHRDKYFGHNLNVFPGRYPVYFDADRSAKLLLLQRSVTTTEQIIERDITHRTSARIDCIVKHSTRGIFVEYATPEDRLLSLKNLKMCPADRVRDRQRKQRLLERDVKQAIMDRVADDPLFLQMSPPSTILEALYQGRIPQIAKTWKKDCVPKRKLNTGDKRIKKRVAAAAERNFGVETTYGAFSNARRTPEVMQARALKKLQKKARQQGVEIYVNTFDIGW